MCSVRDVQDQRHYVRNCSAVTLTNVQQQYYSSIDLAYTQYNGICPYFDGCALTLDNGLCKMTDNKFTFIGQVSLSFLLLI